MKVDLVYIFPVVSIRTYEPLAQRFADNFSAPRSCSGRTVPGGVGVWCLLGVGGTFFMGRVKQARGADSI